MELVWSLPYLIIIAWLLPRIAFFKNSGLTAFTIRGLFLLKSLVGIGLIILYTYYYQKGSSDIFNYFTDGKILYSALANNPFDYFRMITGIQGDTPHLMHYYNEMSFWLKDFNYNLFNDNRTVIRFNALVMPFSFGNIYVHTFVMNALAIVGLTGIFRFFKETLKFNKTLSLIVIALPPSLMFWGSGLLKEGVVLFSLGLLLYSIGQLNKQHLRLMPWIILASALMLFSISKFYVLLAILPGLISWQLSAKKQSPGYTYLIIHILLFSAMFLLPLINEFPDIPNIICRKQNDFINYANSLNHVGSLIYSEKTTPDFWNFNFHALRGFFITLGRPHIMEMHNATSIPAAIENTGTMALIALAIFFRNKKSINNAILLSLSFTIILFALAGMTTPVLGALVRYKIPAQPFLYISLLSLIDWQRVKTPIIATSSIANLKAKLVKLLFKPTH